MVSAYLKGILRDLANQVTELLCDKWPCNNYKTDEESEAALDVYFKEWEELIR